MKKTNLVLSALALIMSAALVFTGCIHDPATQDPVTYTVTFDSDGGSAVSAVTVNEGDAVAEPTAPTKDGYTFAGWYNGEAAYDFAETVVADLTLKASWTVTEYTIEYVLAEGEANAESNPTKYTIETEDITLAAPTGTSEKPNFVAWHKDTVDGETVQVIKKGTTGNIKLVAEFSAKPIYKVIYFNGETKLGEVTVAEGGKIENKTYDVEDYDFEGWYTDAALTAKIEDFSKTEVTAETKVYGKYVKQVTYKVTINGDEQTVKAGSKAKKPETDPEKEGYTFGGWYKDEACTISFDFDKAITEDTVIYAKWNKEDEPVVWPKESATDLIGKSLTYGTDNQFPGELLKFAKVGSKIHFEVENGAENYCKVLFLCSDWSDSGITDAYYEGDTVNKLKFETKDDKGGDVHRPVMEGAGKYYIVVNESLLNVKANFYLFGHAKIKDCYVEYVDGKIEEVVLPTTEIDAITKEITIKNTFSGFSDADEQTPNENHHKVVLFFQINEALTLKNVGITFKVGDYTHTENKDEVEFTAKGDNYEWQLAHEFDAALKDTDTTVTIEISKLDSTVADLSGLVFQVVDGANAVGWWSEISEQINIYATSAE